MKKYNFILVRGLVREAGHWGSFIEQLEQQDYVHSVSTVDLPGNGQYFKLKSPSSVKEMAHFVQSHLPEKEESVPRVLLAVSLGAMVGIEVLNHYSSSYEAAFLMNTSVAGVSPFYQRLKLQSLKHFYEILISPSLEQREMNVLKMVSNFVDNRKKVHKLWVDLAQKRPVTYTNFARQLMAASRYRLPKNKPQCPLFLLASTADRMVDYRCTEKLANKWQVPMALHSEAGHELTLDAGDWVLENLQKNLATLS